MAGHNIALIVMMILAITLLFAAMVLSAMASSSAKKNCSDDTKETAHRFSMYSAVVSGVAVFLISVALIIYIFRAPVSAKVSSLAGSAAEAIQGHADAIQKHAQAVEMTTFKSE